MTVIADTGGIFALYDADDRHHVEVRRIFEELREPIVDFRAVGSHEHGHLVLLPADRG